MLYQQDLIAGAPLVLPIGGLIFLIESTGAAETIDVKLRRDGSEFFRAPGVRRGLRLEVGRPFAEIELTAAVNTTVRFFVASENIQISTTAAGLTISNTDANPVPVEVVAPDPLPVQHVGPVNLSADNVGILSPDTLATVADVAIGAGAQGLVVAAAGAGVQEREVIVKNLFANAAAVRVGDVNTGAARGHELMPGESITLNTLAAVYAWNTGAAGQSLSVVTNSRS